MSTETTEALAGKSRERLITMPLDQWQTALEALREIAGQDEVELALDPDWPRRIAAAALREVDPDATDHGSLRLLPHAD